MKRLHYGVSVRPACRGDPPGGISAIRPAGQGCVITNNHFYNITIQIFLAMKKILRCIVDFLLFLGRLTHIISTRHKHCPEEAAKPDDEPTVDAPERGAEATEDEDVA